MHTFPVSKEDLPWISSELEKENLCSSDIGNENVLIWKVDEEGNSIGFYGLEVYERDALLRSVVIMKNKRISGLGRIMIGDAVEKAKELGISKLYLLTFTAGGFFEKLGFKVINRNSVPQAISQTEEFANFCPDTAICMTKEI